MARTRIGTIIHYQHLFFVSFFSVIGSCVIFPYSIGLEFNYEADSYQKNILSASLFTTYETGPLCWQARIVSNNTGFYPTIRITPNHNIHETIAENILSAQLAGVTDAGVQASIYYLKKKYHRNEQSEAILELLFLQQQKQNDKIMQILKKEYQ